MSSESPLTCLKTNQTNKKPHTKFPLLNINISFDQRGKQRYGNVPSLLAAIWLLLSSLLLLSSGSQEPDDRQGKSPRDCSDRTYGTPEPAPQALPPPVSPHHRIAPEVNVNKICVYCQNIPGILKLVFCSPVQACRLVLINTSFSENSQCAHTHPTYHPLSSPFPSHFVLHQADLGILQHFSMG